MPARIKLLSRRSDLAVLQTDMVAKALLGQWPTLEVVRTSRSSVGDRDRRLDLSTAPDKGIFTSDLSAALVSGEADAAVHSWKDLPIESHPGTVVAATIARADPRDVLLVRRDIVAARPPALAILSSSPRRAFQLETTLRRLLPWPVAELSMTAIRGNVPTRMAKLVAGAGDALVVAKAALDRLLSADAPAATRREVQAAIGACQWMVLPLKEFPTAPAQGAIAIEVATGRADIGRLIREVNHVETWRAAEAERGILASFGGGCAEAVGATVLFRDYGQITSVRAAVQGQAHRTLWSLNPDAAPPPRASASLIWPRPDERQSPRRSPLSVRLPTEAAGLWIARAEALPERQHPAAHQIVWTPGTQTWERLAARGVWVNGCADGLGDAELPAIDLLAGQTIDWLRVTHTSSGDPDALATYVVRHDLPDDLASRSHFYWMSGSVFLEAIARYPTVRAGWHASGPGRTARVIRDALGSPSRTSVWLEYDQWHQSVSS